jgi:hypothetical protein
VQFNTCAVLHLGSEEFLLALERFLFEVVVVHGRGGGAGEAHDALLAQSQQFVLGGLQLLLERLNATLLQLESTKELRRPLGFPSLQGRKFLRTHNLFSHYMRRTGRVQDAHNPRCLILQMARKWRIRHRNNI